jgi:hypothetical protein
VSPSCGSVSLRIYSDKDPDKAETKILDAKTVQRVWNDFRPYLAALGAAPNDAPQ